MRLCRLAVTAGLVCFTIGAQPLRDLGDRRAVKIGAAVDPNRLGETAYADTLAREFSQAEPENAMKFGPIHPGPTTYAFGPADAIVAFARDHKMAMRGHTLVWHNQNPSWVTNGNLTPEQLSSALEGHIRTVVGHYAGQVYAWDVVNEAFNDDGTLRSTIWSDNPGIGQAGTAYIEQAFRWAHAADPQARLFYNDFSAEATNAKSDAIYRMAKDFRTRGVPIDGIGMQMHLTANAPSLASIESNMRRLADLGLEVQITELDVRLPVDSTGAATATSLATQAQIYSNIVGLCLKLPKCTAVQTWGFTDRYSWVPGTFPGMGAALPFDTSYRPKAAYDSIVAAFRTAPPVIAAAGLVNAASYAAEGVAPGEIVALFGATFGPAELTVGPSDVRLFFDGLPAPVLYARVGQAGAVVPFEVAGRASTEVRYEYLGAASNTVTVPVKAAIPGIFTLNSSGAGAGAILDSAFRVVSAENPARRGDAVAMFLTGAGVTAPSSVDGQVYGADLPRVAGKVGVTIGGIDCPVLYAGGAPGLIAGAVQINVQTPAGIAAGEHAIVVTVDGASSQPGVTIALQ